MNELQRQVEAAGYVTSNDQARDLLIKSRERVVALFEAKPDFHSYYLYSAIGQLKYHALGMADVKQVAVLPATTPKHILRRLLGMGIETITFTMAGKKVIFKNLYRDLRSLIGAPASI